MKGQLGTKIIMVKHQSHVYFTILPPDMLDSAMYCIKRLDKRA